MSDRKSNKQFSPNRRTFSLIEQEHTNGKTKDNDDQKFHNFSTKTESQTSPSSSIRRTNSPMCETNRPRSKTVSVTSTSLENDAPSTGFHFLQSIKDLTNQELHRANPLGLLGKEVILATGTTHCPEPIPPNENDELSTKNSIGSSSSFTSPINENEPQQIHFPLNEEEKIQMQKHRSALGNLTDVTLPPCPAEFISSVNDQNLQSHLFSQPSPSTMVADFIPDTMTINVFEVFIYAWGVFAFFFDMVTDLVLAHAYYLEGAYWLFLLTLMCVILPNLTLSVFSLVWYIDSSQLKAAANEERKTEYETSTFSQTDDLIEIENDKDQVDAHISRIRQRPQTPERQLKRTNFRFSAATANILTWFIRIVILLLQLDLCVKYIRGLYYTWKGFQKRHSPKWKRFYLTKQILIDADIALLRVFDCFMDSGSQVVLQLYIMLRLGSTSMKFDTLFAKQSLSIISSLGSLAYALSGYSRCWRHMQLTHSPEGWPKDKPPPQLVSWWSTIIQWFWYLFLITPRVLALAMFAATFRSWFWIILVGHWFGMLFWILRFRTIFCISDQTKYNPREAIFEKCYNLVCSYIFIFCYMNLRKGDTRLHYIGLFTIYFIEYVSFSIIYSIHSAETNSIFKYSLVSFVCLGFWFAILFQFVYYRFLHPSTQVRMSTKQNLASIARIRPMPRFSRIKRSKSCEEMINQNEHNDIGETISLRLNSNSIDERWHNRFSKENRQKLISQQQAIDQKVKITRAQKQLEEATKRQQNSLQGIRAKFSTNFKRSTTIPSELKENKNMITTNGKMEKVDEEDFDKQSISYISNQCQSQSINNNLNEDLQKIDDKNSNLCLNTGNSEEMILTAANLSSATIISPHSTDNKTFSPLKTTTRC